MYYLPIQVSCIVHGDTPLTLARWARPASYVARGSPVDTASVIILLINEALGDIESRPHVHRANYFYQR
jgi:hypothetical protein